jgi:hypothetical protein
MNITFIVLGIVVAILIYVLYLYFSDNSQNILKYQDINDSQISISSDDLRSPGSTRYAYGMWIYINSWDTTSDKILFKRDDDSIIVKLASNTPTLTVKLGENDEILATNNFPLQKWVYVVVSVDNNIVDVYLDGKLVKSERVNETVMPKEKSGLTSGKFDAFVARFKRWAHPLNPQVVYNEYMKGSGQGGMITGYGVDVSVLKDNIEQTKFALL